jgi:hypothetical protein
MYERKLFNGLFKSLVPFGTHTVVLLKFEIHSNLPYRAPLYNKSLSIKGSLIFPIHK